MIKTVIFDLSEVYLSGMLGIGHSLEAQLKGSADEIHDSLFFSRHTQDYFHGLISEKVYWTNLISENNWRISVDELKRVVRNNFREIPGTREIIEELKGRGYKLGLLSVHGREWINYCNKKFDYHKLFDQTMYSYEVGVSKPDKRAYHLVLEKLQSKPAECLFIDDSRKNIAAASEVGINTIHFENPEQLRRELTNYDIEV